VARPCPPSCLAGRFSKDAALCPPGGDTTAVTALSPTRTVIPKTQVLIGSLPKGRVKRPEVIIRIRPNHQSDAAILIGLPVIRIRSKPFRISANSVSNRRLLRPWPPASWKPGRPRGRHKSSRVRIANQHLTNITPSPLPESTKACWRVPVLTRTHHRPTLKFSQGAFHVPTRIFAATFFPTAGLHSTDECNQHEPPKLASTSR
jgi:hypothetical protein